LCVASVALLSCVALLLGGPVQLLKQINFGAGDLTFQIIIKKQKKTDAEQREADFSTQL
jgi:hypothetical protein